MQTHPHEPWPDQEVCSGTGSRSHQRAQALSACRDAGLIEAGAFRTSSSIDLTGGQSSDLDTLLGVELAPGTPILPIIASTFCSNADPPLPSFRLQALRLATARSKSPRLKIIP